MFGCSCCSCLATTAHLPPPPPPSSRLLTNTGCARRRWPMGLLLLKYEREERTPLVPGHGSAPRSLFLHCFWLLQAARPILAPRGRRGGAVRFRRRGQRERGGAWTECTGNLKGSLSLCLFFNHLQGAGGSIPLERKRQCRLRIFFARDAPPPEICVRSPNSISAFALISHALCEAVAPSCMAAQCSSDSCQFITQARVTPSGLLRSR